jgi:hypothetical protein
MNSILSYTILILLVFLVIYLIVKFIFRKELPISNLIERKSLEKVNLNSKQGDSFKDNSQSIRNVIEKFSSEISPEIKLNIDRMKFNFGIDQPDKFYGFSIEPEKQATQAVLSSTSASTLKTTKATETNIIDGALNINEIKEKLHKYFFKIDNNDKHYTTIYSKYLSVYNLVSIKQNEFENISKDLNLDDEKTYLSLNKALEETFYNDKSSYGICGNINQEMYTMYNLKKTIFEVIANFDCYSPKKGKFSKFGVDDFIDFGILNSEYQNIYIKNARFILDNSKPAFTVNDIINIITDDNYNSVSETAAAMESFTSEKENNERFEDINLLSNLDINFFDNPSLENIYNNIINSLDTSTYLLDASYVNTSMVRGVILPTQNELIVSFEQMDPILDSQRVEKVSESSKRLSSSIIEFTSNQSTTQTGKNITIFIFIDFILIQTENNMIFYHRIDKTKILNFSKSGFGKIKFDRFDTTDSNLLNGADTVKFLNEASRYSNEFKANLIQTDIYFKWAGVFNYEFDTNDKLSNINIKIDDVELNNLINNGTDDNCLKVIDSDSSNYLNIYVFNNYVIYKRNNIYYVGNLNGLHRKQLIDLYQVKNNDSAWTDLLSQYINLTSEGGSTNYYDYKFENKTINSDHILTCSKVSFEWDPEQSQSPIDQDSQSPILSGIDAEKFVGSQVDDSIKNTKYIDQFRREVMTLQMEYLYAVLAQVLNRFANLSVEVTDTHLNNLIGSLNIFGSGSDNIFVKNYLHVVLLLLKFKLKIDKDDFIDKFNCKYITYLFYSFNKGMVLFGDYIKNIFTNEEYLTFKLFFENYQFEGLYKLFIVSINKKCNIFYEYETDKNKLSESFSLATFLDDPNYIDFNIKQFFFYERRNELELNKQCSAISYDNCNPLDTDNFCSWKGSKDSGICSAVVDSITTCFDNKNGDSCNSNNNCQWDKKTEICSPKNCISDDGKECKYENISHCKQYSDYDENSNNIITKCYDNDRVMYVSRDNVSNKDSNPVSFFQNNDSHLDRCINQVYDSKTNEFVQLFDAKCKHKEGCNLLKRRNEHNNSEFRTCVNDDLIEYNNFFSCYELDNEDECDSQSSSLMSCFWQDGKCHKRDAPLSWVTPGSKNFGLEDMTHCNNFISEYSCPEDRCVWLNDKCISKENHPYFDTDIRVKVNKTDQVIPDIPIKRELVDCMSINNNKNIKEDDRKLECTSFKCKLKDNKCLNNVGGSCELYSSKDACLHPSTNFNSKTQQNNCRWSENQTNLNGVLSEGYCTDTRMNQPCGLFSEPNCPTTPKIDNFGNIIENSNHCKVENNKCVTNTEFMNEDKYDNCQYNYLNTGKCDNVFCRELNLKSLNDDNDTIKKCVHKERIPCSLLTREDCFNRNIHLDNCFFDSGKERCETTQNFADMLSSLNTVNDINQNDYKKILSIKNEFNDINLINRENKKYFLKDTNPIFGIVTKLESIDTSTNSIQRLYTNSNRLQNVNKNDLITITFYNNEANNIKIIPINNVFKVYNIDITKGIIEIERQNINDRLLSINNKDNLNLQEDSNLANKVIWTIENPNVGLFDSYQYAQAIEDSLKINDFYKNLF